MLENTITLICFRLNLFAYDAQGRITVQRRGANVNNKSGGEYVYYSGTNKLKSVANGMGGESADKRSMSAFGNFVYDSVGNLVEDNSKSLKISYDWRGMPVEFLHETGDNSKDYKLLMAYDYRAFGEQVDLTELTDKVTENFTGKEKDDETELNYFGARYLDPMLGMWTSVDPARQFSSPYLYAGNGYNPVNGVDDDGNVFVYAEGDNVTPGFVASFVSKLSPEARARYDQLDKSSNYYYLRKIDEVYQDPDFNDDMNSLGGVAFARSFKKDGKDVVGGEAEFANARYFLHEVLQHLFDFDNELKKNGGNAEAANKSYSDNRVEWEQRAEDFQDEENMPGVDLDEY